MIEEVRALRVKALEETVLAYYRRGDRIQYDSVNLTHLDRFKGGPHRRTDPVSPEGATKDSYLFTVCSSFGYNVLKDAFNYDLCGDPLRHTCSNVLDYYKDYIKFSYVRANPGDVKEKDAMRQCLAAMQPGDVLLVSNGTTLHYMYRLSENRLAHSAGFKFNMETGEEKWDSPGSIRVNDIDDFLLNVLGGYPFSKMTEWHVIDVLGAIDPEKYPITPAAQSRLDYPSLSIDRVVSLRRYQTAQPGDPITVTLQLHNENTRKSKICYESLEIEEQIPAHTTLLESSMTADMVKEGNTLRWKLPFAQGEERIIQYTVRVDENAQPGTELVFRGRVANIPSCEIRRMVAQKHLPISVCEKLQKMANEPAADAEEIYARLGAKLHVPTAWELISGLYEFVEVDDAYSAEENGKHDVLVEKETADPAALKAMKMAAPQLIGGKMLLCVPTDRRVLELRGENLFPGDVIVVARELTRKGCKEEQWTILGGGKAVHIADGKKEIVDLPYFDILLATDYFVVLRPYLTETIN